MPSISAVRLLATASNAAIACITEVLSWPTGLLSQARADKGLSGSYMRMIPFERVVGKGAYGRHLTPQMEYASHAYLTLLA